MKEQSVGKLKTMQGMATMEMMIAMALLVLVICSILPLVSGAESISISTETSQAGLMLAVNNIEKARARLRSEFNASISADLGSDFFYSPDLEITDISPCSKKVRSSVDWVVESRSQFSQLATVITSTEESELLGVICDPLPPVGDWNAPRSFDIFSPSNFDGQGTGVAVNYINGIRYAFLVTGETPGENFYVIDASDPSESFIESRIKIGEHGLNGISVVGNYAYVLYNDIENQLIVVDVSNPSEPIVIEKDEENIGYTLPNMTENVSPIPLSISYYNQKLYIGTQYLAFGNPGKNEELHVFDVSTPQTPVWQSSIDVDRRINDIIVRGSIAYLATGPGTIDWTPLRIYDLSTGALISEFQNTNNWHGKSLYLLGNKLYFGLERKSTGSNPEFYIFNISNPLNPPVELGSKTIEDFTPAGSAAITGIFVQGNLAFLITSDSNDERLYIMDISNPSDPVRINTCSSTPPLPAVGTGIIYMDDYLFVSIRSNEAFRIIYPSVCE